MKPEIPPNLGSLAILGNAAGARLKALGQTIAVADGASGGLISAGLLAMPGASAYYKGGGVIYTIKGRRLLLDHEPGSFRPFKGVTEDYALALAEAVRKRFASDWGVAESGAAGPGVHPYGVPSGRSAVAAVGPGCAVSIIIETGSDDRLANMAAFAAGALALLRDALNRPA